MEPAPLCEAVIGQDASEGGAVVACEGASQAWGDPAPRFGAVIWQLSGVGGTCSFMGRSDMAREGAGGAVAACAGASQAWVDPAPRLGAVICPHTHLTLPTTLLVCSALVPLTSGCRVGTPSGPDQRLGVSRSPACPSH